MLPLMPRTTRTTLAAAAPGERSRRLARARARDEDADDVSDSAPPPALLRRAVRLVDYRERSSGELLKRLREGGGRPPCPPASESAARRVVARLEAAGLVDDARFAELFVARRWRGRSESPGAIRRALFAAGVPAEVGDAALAAFFGDDDARGGSLRPPAGPVRGSGGDGGEDDEEEEEEGQEDAIDGGAGGGSSPASRWRALVAAAREQARRGEALAPDKRRARLARWLAARGHSWDTVAALVREVGL